MGGEGLDNFACDLCCNDVTSGMQYTIFLHINICACTEEKEGLEWRLLELASHQLYLLMIKIKCTRSLLTEQVLSGCSLALPLIMVSYIGMSCTSTQVCSLSFPRRLPTHCLKACR